MYHMYHIISYLSFHPYSTSIQTDRQTDSLDASPPSPRPPPLRIESLSLSLSLFYHIMHYDCMRGGRKGTVQYCQSRYRDSSLFFSISVSSAVVGTKERMDERINEESINHLKSVFPPHPLFLKKIPRPFPARLPPPDSRGGDVCRGRV